MAEYQEYNMYICENCGLNDVEQKQWVNPNTEALGEMVSEESNDTWCNNCNEHVDLIHKNDSDD
jgi:hypothetical protein